MRKSVTDDETPVNNDGNRKNAHERMLSKLMQRASMQTKRCW